MRRREIRTHFGQFPQAGFLKGCEVNDHRSAVAQYVHEPIHASAHRVIPEMSRNTL
jgi:hypothetical protein